MLLRHLALLSSPAEALHLSNCSRVRLENVTVANPAYPDGTRGLVIESSSDVEVETANVSTGGDCVVLQSGCVRGKCQYCPGATRLPRDACAVWLKLFFGGGPAVSMML